MIKEIILNCMKIIQPVIEKCSGHDRWLLLAELVINYGVGGQSFISGEFGISRGTLRKGSRELKLGTSARISSGSGEVCGTAHRTDAEHHHQRAGVPPEKGPESKTEKKIAETDAIFENLQKVHKETAEDSTTADLESNQQVRRNIS